MTTSTQEDPTAPFIPLTPEQIELAELSNPFLKNYSQYIEQLHADMTAAGKNPEDVPAGYMFDAFLKGVRTVLQYQQSHLQHLYTKGKEMNDIARTLATMSEEDYNNLTPVNSSEQP